MRQTKTRQVFSPLLKRTVVVQVRLRKTCPMLLRSGGVVLSLLVMYRAVPVLCCTSPNHSTSLYRLHMIVALDDVERFTTVKILE
jgi:hypothetical protein